MKNFILASIAIAAIGSSLATSARAVVYVETGDAGDLPSSAQIVSGAAGTPLTGINGALTLTNGVSDSDLFQIYINDPSTFSASLTSFVPGSNNFDSQLGLFNAAGQGIELDDDDPATGAPQSNLPAGSSFLTSSPAGVYYLLISGSGRYASTGSGSLIFANFTDGTTDPTAVQGPISPDAVVGAYSGSSNEAGSYVLALSGAQFVVVPEPGAWALISAGMVGAWFFVRRRRLLA